MEIVPHRTSFASLSPLGEACSRKDLTAIHEILENIGYQDDEVPIGLPFHVWTDLRKDTVNCKKKGDAAFFLKDFKEAMKCYTQIIDGRTSVSSTIYARRSFCYLANEMANEALMDAMEVQLTSPEWYIAYYLQSVALATLGMENEAQELIKEGTRLESKKNAYSKETNTCY
ncbi:serine/threonine-protein kinase BSK3 [Trifolium repens]|nr:serine/threonine-protein kinase BSK3 [Trifolium repens]